MAIKQISDSFSASPALKTSSASKKTDENISIYTTQFPNNQNGNIQGSYKEKLDFAIDVIKKNGGEYAELLNKFEKSGYKFSIEPLPQNEVADGKYDHSNKKIILYQTKFNTSSKMMLKNVLHELKHFKSNDSKSSLAEEADCEKSACAYLCKMFNKPLNGLYDENRFLSPYKAKGMSKYSPGYGGIPLQSGVTSNEPFTRQKDGSYSNGVGTTFIFKWGETKDLFNNKYPTNAIVKDNNGQTIKYSKYNHSTSSWTK